MIGTIFDGEPKYRAEIERPSDAAAQAIRSNARASSVEFVALEETLRSFLDEVLAAAEPAAASGQNATPAGKSGGDQLGAGAVVAASAEITGARKMVPRYRATPERGYP